MSYHITSHHITSHHIDIDIKFPIMAGESVKNTADRPEDPNNTWSEQISSTFELRIGPDYERNKKKAPAGTPLFELLGMDLFSSDAKVDHIASKLRFPSEWTEGDLSNTNNSHILPIFVVNVQVPKDMSTNLFSIFEEIDDGVGFSLVYYYRSVNPYYDFNQN